MVNYTDITKIEKCPECGTTWIDKPIPEQYWENYSPPYFYSRVIGCYDRDLDRTAYWKCPDCEHHFDRSWG